MHYYLQYGLAEDTLRTGGSGNAKEPSPNELYSLCAIYIAAAHALKPSYPVCAAIYIFYFGCLFVKKLSLLHY